MAKVDGVVYKITEAQAACFKTAFGIFDSDGDGYVTVECATQSTARNACKMYACIEKSSPLKYISQSTATRCFLRSCAAKGNQRQSRQSGSWAAVLFEGNL